MKPVLFASTRPFERAENIRALYNAYDGLKKFIQVDGRRWHPAIESGYYDLMVIDEFPTCSPGKCIMIWHAIQGGKTIGVDQPHPYYAGWQSKYMDYLVTSGSGAVPMFEKCSTLPEGRVLALGMPRTDGYARMRKGDGGTVLAAKRSYLYAPTFRGEGEGEMPMLDWDWLDEELTDDELLCVKAHTMTGTMLKKEYRHIMEADCYEPSAPYLCDCDAVISDYSSIIFDGYLLGKPAVLIEKAPGYTGRRGMYMRYPEEYCSRFCTDEGGMLKLLRSAKKLTAVEKDCLKRVADACDGHATERVIGLIRRLADK